MKNPELLGVRGVGRTNDNNNLLEIIIIFGAFRCLDQVVVPLNFCSVVFMMVPSVNRHVYLGKKMMFYKAFSSMMVACCTIMFPFIIGSLEWFLPILGT